MKYLVIPFIFLLSSEAYSQSFLSKLKDLEDAVKDVEKVLDGELPGDKEGGTIKNTSGQTSFTILGREMAGFTTLSEINSDLPACPENESWEQWDNCQGTRANWKNPDRPELVYILEHAEWKNGEVHGKRLATTYELYREKNRHKQMHTRTFGPRKNGKNYGKHEVTVAYLDQELDGKNAGRLSVDGNAYINFEERDANGALTGEYTRHWYPSTSLRGASGDKDKPKNPEIFRGYYVNSEEISGQCGVVFTDEKYWRRCAELMRASL